MWLGQSVVYASGTGNEAATSPFDQAFFLFVLVSSFIVASSRGVKWSELIKSNAPIMLFYLYFAVSVLWSGDPTGSVKRLIKDFGMLFVIGVLFSEKNPLQAIRAVYVRCACVLFPLSVVFIKYFPNLARGFTVEGEPIYSGVTTQKNTLGEIVMVFSIFVVWDYLETQSTGKKKWWRRIPWDRVLLMLMGFWLLKMSQSKTASLCLIIGVLLVIKFRFLAPKFVRRAVLCGALSLPFLLFFSQQFSSVIAPIVEAMGRNMTFTGRTDIWQHITTQTVNPMIGAGYWNFWGGPGGFEISQAMQTPVPNAHCGYLDIYLDGGMIGLIILFFMLTASGNRLLKKVNLNRFQNVRLAILIVVIVYNLSESIFARLGPLWFTTLLALVEFPAPRTFKKIRSGIPQLGNEVTEGRTSRLLVGQ